MDRIVERNIYITEYREEDETEIEDHSLCSHHLQNKLTTILYVLRWFSKCPLSCFFALITPCSSLIIITVIVIVNILLTSADIAI